MLKDKKVAELREIAEAFGVDLEGITKKADIVAALEADGVTSATLAEFDDAETVETEKAEPKKVVGPTVLVKMEKANPTYEIRGHKFSNRHPYVAMSESEAQDLFDLEPRGFRIATPNEVKEYYS